MIIRFKNIYSQFNVLPHSAIRLGFFIGMKMLQNIFKNYLRTVNKDASKRQINNLQRANKSLLIRISKCFDTLIKYEAGVDYFVPIYSDKFNLDNKIRKKTLDILKQEGIIKVKTNDQGKESYQCSFTRNKKRMDINNPTPKCFSFTEYGWSLIHDQQFINEIKLLIPSKPSKYSSPEEFSNEILKKAAEDNLSLVFKLDKPLPDVVEEYLDSVKEDWNVTDKNYHSKYKEAQQVVLNTISNYNNKLLKVKERMYTALSLCPKELRKYFITSQGEHIDEAFDINSSILTLLSDTLQLYMKENNISIPAKFYNEKKQLLKSCFNPNKHVYNLIGGSKYTKDQIKPHIMQVVFSNNEDIQKMDKNNSPRNYIKNYIKDNLPVMWSLLIQFPQQENEDYETEMQKYNQFIDQISLYNAGLSNIKPRHINHPKKIKSTIWRYFQRVESQYMLQLKSIIEDKLNTTSYWIHDCICLKSSIINNSIRELIFNQFHQLVINNSIRAFNSNKNNKKVSSIIQGMHDEDKQKSCEYDQLKDEIDNLIKYKEEKEIKNEIFKRTKT